MIFFYYYTKSEIMSAVYTVLIFLFSFFVRLLKFFSFSIYLAEVSFGVNLIFWGINMIDLEEVSRHKFKQN